MILLLVLFSLKHFVFDFLYQPPWQYENKGTYMHLGGIAHALQHALPTFFILLLVTHSPLAGVLAAAEFFIHYHVDWAKMKLNSAMQWGPLTSANFWRLLGLDQLLHQLTYAWLIWVVT